MNRTLLVVMLLLGLVSGALPQDANGQAKVAASDRIECLGYTQCIELKNDHARVVLCPEAGGRVLEYAWNGATGLYQAPAPKAGGRREPAGRFDVGPEFTLPRHPALWSGPWTGARLGPLAARMTSVKDKATGLQLVRTFTLDPATSHLTCTQTMTNVGERLVSTCHWSRTMSSGNGIVLIPLTSPSRFPKSYLMYGPGPVMEYQPVDPNIRIRDGFLEIVGAPARPKLGFDSAAGWFCYLTRNDLLFVKRFPVYPDRPYNEVAGLTVSIWYFEDKMCELEPIGPAENLAPGQSASFTEQWWLLPYKFPANGAAADLQQISRLVEQQAR